MLSPGKRVAGSGWATTTGVGSLGGSGTATTGEEGGLGAGISCAGFGSCPGFCTSFSPPFFAAPQTPSRSKVSALLQIHLVLRGLPPATFLFLRHQHPNLAKPAAQALHRGGIYAQSFSHFLHGFAPDRILFRCDLEDMAKEAAGRFWEGAGFSGLLGFLPRRWKRSPLSRTSSVTGFSCNSSF
jgi:hypothetical protein